MAQLSSLLRLKSRRWPASMMHSTSSRAASGVSGVLPTGSTLPLIFTDGGTPTVMNRSEALLSTISLRRLSNSIPSTPHQNALAGPSEIVRHLGLFPGHFPGHHLLLDQLVQALVHGLHAVGGAGLDRRIHLRHLVLADQVADRRGADHDLVGGDPPAADLLHQGLGEHRL